MLVRSKAIYIILIALLFCLGPTVAAQAFVDSRNHWAEATVEHLGARQIINGYSDGRFLPDQSITRAEMCRLLVSMLNSNDDANTLKNITPIFKDVTSTHWASGDIYYLYEQGIVNGDEQGQFNPNAFLRRDEAIVMLLRTLKITPVNDQMLADFKDKDSVPEYAAGYFGQGIKDGFIQGYPDQTLRPANTITRAELAILIERCLNYQSNEYQFWGKLVQYDRSTNRLKILLNGNTETWFNIVSGLKVYDSKGKRISLSELEVPGNLYFDLDTDGRIVFLRAADWEPQYRVRIDAQEPKSTDQQNNILNTNQPIQLYNSDDKELSNNYILTDPASSIEVNKKDMQIIPLTEQNQANGRDVLVAVIDTGVDPGHPDLQITASGQRKLVDFIDYTDEGRVDLPDTANINTGWTYMGKKVDLSRVRSVSGKVKIGYWDEGRYDAASILSDFNGNGTRGDKVLVVAADRSKAGVYDTIYVDHNGNGDIRDEMPIQVYRESKQYAVFPTADGWGFDYVVSSLSADGSYVQFGFDSQGHGTHVAGVVAAYGQMQGMAPDARLLVIKVAGTDGLANEQAMEKGLRKAAEMGAQVVNVSMGTAVRPELVNTVNELSKKYGALFVISVGNSGPGLGTITDPGSADEALRVGAFVSPAQGETNYGWKLKKPIIWYFSSMGPKNDGALGPQVVAPGSVYSATPLWQKTKYKLDEGTSMAAPHLSGGIAVLIDALMRNNQVVVAGKIKNAILQSAVSLDGYSLLEQGYGAVDLAAAYESYTKVTTIPLLKPSEANPDNMVERGLYARHYLPGEVPITIDNNDKRGYNLVLGSDFADAQTEQTKLLLPKQGQRSFMVRYKTPEQPGIYSGFVTVDDPATNGIELKVPQVVIVPYDLSSGYHQVNLDGNLPAGMIQRYFIRVPAGTANLEITLKVPLLNRQYMGRVRMHVYSPAGEEMVRTAYAGYGASPGDAGLPQVNASVNQPVAGVWEVTVYSTATLSMYNDDASEYAINLQLQEPGKDVYVNSNHYIVSTVAGTIGDSKEITLQIRESNGMDPYTGPVSVDGRMYYVQNGHLRIPKPSGDNPHIYLTWQ